MQLNLITYNTAISSFGKARQWQMAVEFVFEGLGRRRMAPDLISYNSLLNGFGLAQQWMDALFLLEQMQELRVRADSFSYSATIHACGESSEWQQACELLSAAPLVTCVMENAAMEACCTASMWPQALSLFDGIDSPSAGSFKSALVAAKEGQQWLLALHLFSEMEKANKPRTVNAWNTVIQAVLSGASVLRALERHPRLSAVPAVGAGQLDADPAARGTAEDRDSAARIAFAAAMNAGQLESHWHQAVVFFDASRRLGFDDEEADLFLLCALDKACHWSSCLQHLKSGRSGSEEELRERNVAINACSRELRWQRACTLLHQLPIDQMQGSLVSYHSALLSLPWRSGLEILELLGGVPLCSLDTCHAESLIGQPLFPHVSYRHASLMVNFGKTPFTKMPFVCRMVADAASVNAVVTPSPMGKDGKCELLMPVAFPDEGTFDWLDSFLEKNPQYVELSERKIMDWAIATLFNASKASNDKPIFQYGLPSMDDQSMMRVLQSISPMTPRNYVVMEVKSNLVAEERAQILKRFPSTSFKKVARVVMGEPKEEYKTRVRNQILKVKQHKSDVTWRMKKAQQEQRKRIAEQQKLMAEKKKEFEEKKKAEEEAKKKEEEEAKAKEAEPKESPPSPTSPPSPPHLPPHEARAICSAVNGRTGEEEEEAKPEEEADTEMKDEKEAAEEEPKEEAKEELVFSLRGGGGETKDEEEDLGEEPPAVELTEEEEKQFFPTKGYLSDLAPSVLAKARKTASGSFNLPSTMKRMTDTRYEGQVNWSVWCPDPQQFWP
eukprot:g9636.t1